MLSQVIENETIITQHYTQDAWDAVEKMCLAYPQLVDCVKKLLVSADKNSKLHNWDKLILEARELIQGLEVSA